MYTIDTRHRPKTARERGHPTQPPIIQSVNATPIESPHICDDGQEKEWTNQGVVLLDILTRPDIGSLNAEKNLSLVSNDAVHHNL